MTQTDEFSIFHLMSSPFYNRRVNAITIPDYQQGSLYTIFVFNSFYPAFLPESGKFVSLTVTSDSLKEKVTESLGKQDELVLVNPHTTRIRDNYVSYGQVIRHPLPTQLFELYLDDLKFQLSIDRPMIIKKMVAGNKELIPISITRHFDVKSNTKEGPEHFDCTYNAMLFKITKENFRNARKTSKVVIGAQTFTMVSMFASILYLNDKNPLLIPLNVMMDFRIYKQLARRGEGVYICHLYTIYNVMVGEQERSSVNILVRAVFFDYSLEALIPFIIPAFEKTDISLLGLLDLSYLDSIRAQMLKGFQEMTKSIRSSKNWYQISEEQNRLRFVCLSPAVIFRFLKAYIMFPNQKKLLLHILTEKHLVSVISDFLNTANSHPFYDGAYVDPELLNFLRVEH